MKEEIINNIYKDNGFIKSNNFKIIELNDKECIMEYIIKKDGLNPIKIVHGGLLFGLADTAAGTLAGMSGKFPLTMSSNIHYLNPAKGKKIIAKATILKEGNNIGYYKVDVFDENNIIVCTCNVDMYLRKIDK